ncbi:MAG TPA: AAA family ATPase [Acidimicrobiales bacterium]|nr:AAA family ATPase [Acidimicrobiales bacterium]
MAISSTPGCGAAGGALAAVAETHSGVVFLVGDRAYKLKKPVSLGFLDFRTREARELACHREVELNRRLAPDVYLGVADLVDAAGPAFDHLVVMRRLPEDRRLAGLVASGAEVGEHLRRLATLLARFHAGASRAPEIDAAARGDALTALWQVNAVGMEHLDGALWPAELEARVLALARRYLAGRGTLLEERISAGRVRDGHGDLLADDIFCLDDGPRVLDCVEFDDRLRYVDVLSDVAFLAMDLERLGRADLAASFLDEYRRQSGDTWPVSLEHHYVAYRAQVRAKVAGLRMDAGIQPERSARAARELLGLSAAHLEAGRVRLVVVGGLPGSGKSSLASAVGEALGAAVVRSDEVRKALAGLEPTTPAEAPFGEGLYRPEATAATYAELLERGRTWLSRGRSVVLDASFHDPAWRAGARQLAAETVSDLDELHCSAPQALLERRVARRARRDGEISDANVAVVRKLAASEPPWPGAAEIDSRRSPGATRRMAFERLGIVRTTAPPVPTPASGR